MLKRWLLGILLLLPTSALAGPLTIPIDGYFNGVVDAERLLGGDRLAGWPNYVAGHGLITFAENPVPGNAVHVTGLEISQQFISWLDCDEGPCSSNTFDVSLHLEGTGSLFISDQGHPSGQLSVLVDAVGVQESAMLNVEEIGFGTVVKGDPDPLAPGGLLGFRWYEEGPFPNYLMTDRVRIEGRIVFDNTASPLAGLFGLQAVPEPSILGMFALVGYMTLLQRRAFSGETRERR